MTAVIALLAGAFIAFVGFLVGYGVGFSAGMQVGPTVAQAESGIAPQEIARTIVAELDKRRDQTFGLTVVRHLEVM